LYAVRVNRSCRSHFRKQVIAQSLQLAIEYDPAPPFDSASPEKAPHALIARMLTRLRANFRYPDLIARHLENASMPASVNS
jgi:hypothetical protein